MLKASSPQEKPLSPTKQALIALKRMQAELDALKAEQRESIAIIGMACRFPGGADTPEKFWEMLRSGVDAVKDIPPTRWDPEIYCDPDPVIPGRTYLRRAALLDSIDEFDAPFFNIAPREAVMMDPQQRLLLELCWEALERAAVAPESLHATRSGVFMGLATQDYAHIAANPPAPSDIHTTTGNAISVAAGRIAYFLGLRGPVLVVDTACSSSLAAVHLACQSLRMKECSLALAGGITLLSTPLSTVLDSQIKCYAPDGRCKTFDAAADGYGRGEGGGVLVLRRLSDAIQDRDMILGVIRGSAMNHDGRSGGLTVPSGSAQQVLIRDALENAGVEAGQVGYLEAHGTGTSLGDPIEMEAIREVFGWRAEPLFVGSVKTNIGHLEAAAGIAGLIKAVLTLQNREIPPHLHLKQPNPVIPWDRLSIQVPREPTPFPQQNEKRIAGVSSFGLSGTNVFMIVEDLPLSHTVPTLEHHVDLPSCFLLPLSAQTEKGLGEMAASYLDIMKAHPSLSFGDICYTAGTGRSHFNCRAGIVAASAEDARYLLAELAVSEREKDKQIVFLFTGHGVQYPGMGQGLYQTCPAFREAIDACEPLIQSYTGFSLVEVIESDAGSKEGLLDNMIRSQPAIFALGYALANVWRSWGIEPDLVMGHSIGEYVAAYVAGVFDLEDALKLVCARGRLMDAVGKGRMASVFATPETVASAMAPFQDRVSVASVNSDYNLVISGAAEAVEAMIDKFTADDIAAKLLDTGYAGHSPLLDPILDDFEQIAQNVTYRTPRIELVSGLTGKIAKGDMVCNAIYWRRHLREPVQFAGAMAAIFESRDPIVLEIGPHPNLSNLGPASLPDYIDREGIWLSSLHKKAEDWRWMLDSLKTLYIHGAPVEWAGVCRRFHPCRKVLLPTYPFQRQRYWVEQAGQNAKCKAQKAKGKIPHQDQWIHPLLGKHKHTPALRNGKRVFETLFTSKQPLFLDDHKVYGETIMAGAAWLEMARAAAGQAGMGGAGLEDIAFHQPLVLSEDVPQIVQIILTPQADGTAEFEIFSDPSGPDSASDAEWTLHAEGRVTATPSPDMIEKDGDISPDMDSILGRLTQEVSGPDLYQQFHQQGIEYGPAFRVLETVWRNKTEALGRIRLPASVVAEYQMHQVGAIHELPLHEMPRIVSLLDACFQCAGSLIHGTDVHIPAHIEKMVFFNDPVPDMWCHVQISKITRQGYTADIILFSPGKGVIGTIKGFTEQKIEAKNLRAAPWKDWLYETKWDSQSLSHWQGAMLSTQGRTQGSPLQGTWIVFEDDGGVGRLILEKLRKNGVRCLLVTTKDTSALDDPDVRTLPGHEPAWNQDKAIDALRDIFIDIPDMSGIVFLRTCRDAMHCVSTGWGLGEGFCWEILCLVQSLAALPPDRPQPRLFLTTCGAQPAGESEIDPTGAMVWGMGKVIALEHPEWRCTRIDLDPSDDDEASARGLYSELAAPAPGPDLPLEDQIAYRRGIRLVARLKRYVPKPARPLPIRPDRTYLITGGLGGLGFLAARRLAKQGAGRLLLAGRRPLGETARKKLDELTNKGTPATYTQTDITDSAQLAGALKMINPEYPLGGVLHAAGVLDDGILTHQAYDRFARVLSPKVKGGWNLHLATQDVPLDFFVLFSSDAAILGNGGQANHAAANAFLDAMAWYRRRLKLPALSINWGAWSTIGAAAKLSQWIDRQGQGMIPPDQGIEVLEILLRTDAVQAVVSPVDWKRFAVNLPRLALWAEWGENDNPEKGWIREQLYRADNPETLLLDLVREETARVLGWERPDQIDIKKPFFNLGMDSLTALELRNRLQAGLDIKLASTLIFKYPNVAEVAAHCASRLFPVFAQNHGATEEQRSVGTDFTSKKADAEHLSQEALGDLLDEKLSQLEKWLR